MVVLTDTAASSPGSSRARGTGRPDLSEVALDLHAQPTSDATLDRVVTTVGLTVPCDDAGILLVASRQRTTTAAATTEAVRRAHDLQVELDEGPCLDAIDAESGHYLCLDTTAEDRWPRWAPAVADLGYRSVLSVRLGTHERRYGSLNLYSHRVAAFDDADLRALAAFGRVASVAIATAMDLEGLQEAIDGRRSIGIAMGMLVERYGLETEPAFEVLRRYSQHHNVKLRDVARVLVEEGDLPTA